MHLNWSSSEHNSDNESSCFLYREKVCEYELLSSIEKQKKKSSIEMIWLFYVNYDH